MTRRILLFTVIALLAAACGTQSATSLGAQQREPSVGHWLLDSGTDDGADLVILDTHPIGMTLNGSRITGTAACNSYGGVYTLDEDGGFNITDGVAVTEMWCGDQDVMDSEQAYLDALQNVDRLEITTSGLVLTGGGAELRFVANPDGGDVPPEDQDGGDDPVSSGFFPSHSHGSWILISGESAGRVIPMVDSHHVRIKIGPDSIGGTVCNSFGAIEPFPADGSFPDIASTLMACEEPAMQSEAAFLDALSRYERAEIIDGNLVIRGQDTVLTFRPDPDAPADEPIDKPDGDGSNSTPGQPGAGLFPPETHGTWTLVDGQFNGATLQPSPEFPALLEVTSDGVGGRVCNAYGIVFDEDGRPADFNLTRVDCGDTINELEELFLKTLSQGEIAVVMDGQLVIRGSIGSLIFESA